MTDFEEYFKVNREAFNGVELPEGHELRFRARLKKAEGRRRRLVRRLCFVAAAAAALIFMLNISGTGKWFVFVGNEPVKVYLAYSERAASICEKIYSSDICPGMENDIKSIVQEPVILLEQLPETMSDAEKAKILKEYYGRILDGLEQMM